MFCSNWNLPEKSLGFRIKKNEPTGARVLSAGTEDKGPVSSPQAQGIRGLRGVNAGLADLVFAVCLGDRIKGAERKHLK